MSRERVDNWCEKGILGLVLAILVFAPLAFGAVRIRELLVVQLLTICALGLWAVRFVIRTEYRVLWPPVCWVVIAVLGLAVARYHQAPVEYVARLELIRIVIYACLFFVILDNLNRQGPSQTIALTLIFLGMLVAGYGVYQFLTNSPYVWGELKPEQYMKRASGTYVCPNHFAGFLELILPLGLAFTLLGRVNHTLRVFVGYASIVMLVGIGVSLSRGGWLATGFASLVFFVLLSRHQTYRIPAIICFIGIVAAGVYFVGNSFIIQKRLFVSFEHGVEAETRLRLWKPAVKIWLDHFWFGAGPAHYDLLFAQHRPVDIQMRPLRAHNDYLNLLADWGLAGGLALVAGIVCLAWTTWNVWKHVQRGNDLGSKRSSRGAMVLGAIVALAAIMAHSIVDFNMHIPANAIIAVALAAILSGYSRFATERFWVNPGLAGRVMGVALCGLAIAYLSMQGVKLRAEDQAMALVEQAEREDFLEWKIENLKTAHEAAPANPETPATLGQILWAEAAQRPLGYEALGAEALHWLETAIKLNPYDARNYLNYGLCLDLLGKEAEADPFIERALVLDPNSYYVRAQAGWHYLNKGDFATARGHLEKSAELQYRNPLAMGYLDWLNKAATEE